VDLNGALQASGKAQDVIVASNGASVFLYVKNHDRDTIRTVVEQLKKTEGVDLLFTASGATCSPKAEKGFVPGTFALELVDQCRAERGADIVATFQWSSEVTNGFKGSQKIATNDKRQHVPGRAGHGGLNPYMVHTPLILFGPDFRGHAVVEAPTANFDIAPTVLKLEGVPAPATMSGRVIGEALAKGTAKEQKAKVRTVMVRDGVFCSEVRVSELGTKRYVDQGERCQ
jgi:arylsulfatase A-like enzyme